MLMPTFFISKNLNIFYIHYCFCHSVCFFSQLTGGCFTSLGLRLQFLVTIGSHEHTATGQRASPEPHTEPHTAPWRPSAVSPAPEPWPGATAAHRLFPRFYLFWDFRRNRTLRSSRLRVRHAAQCSAGHLAAVCDGGCSLRLLSGVRRQRGSLSLHSPVGSRDVLSSGLLQIILL